MLHGMGILGFPRRISDYADQLTGVMQHHGLRLIISRSHHGNSTGSAHIAHGGILAPGGHY